MKAVQLLPLISAVVCTRRLLTTKKERNQGYCNVTLPWTVPSSAFRDISDPVFARVMECPVGLHGCSEQIVSCSPRTYEVTCSCASNCKVYGDCCWNIDIDGKITDTKKSLSSCVKLRTFGASTQGIYMVIGCPPTWAMNDVRTKCEDADLMNDTFYKIPATSVNNITYRNAFCALCNEDIVNATFWRALVYEAHRKVSVGVPDTILQKPGLHLRPCTGLIDDTCAKDATESVYWKCKTYYAPVVQGNYEGSKIYKNVYCAMCNGEKLANLSCAEVIHVRNIRVKGYKKTSRKKGYRTGSIPSLAAMFRPVRSSLSCYAEYEGQCYIKMRRANVHKVALSTGGEFVDNESLTTIAPAQRRNGPSDLYHFDMYVTVTSMSLSICCLVLKIVVFCAYVEARSFSSKCTLCLCVTLMFTQVAFLIISWSRLSADECVAPAVLIHYGFLSTMTWTSTLSFDIWRNLTTAKVCSSHGRDLLTYACISWGLPLVVIVVALIVGRTAPGSTVSPAYGVRACWIGTTGGHILYFLAPMSALMLFCVLMYVKTVCYIRRTSATARSREKDTGIRASFQNNNAVLFLRLALIMGAAWALAFIGYFLEIVQIDLVVNALVGLEGAYLFFAFRDYRYLCGSVRRQAVKSVLNTPRTTSLGNTSFTKKC